MDTKIFNNSNKCIGCRACSAICPDRMIYITELEWDNRISYHLHYKHDVCTCHHCNAPCIDICPENAISIERY